MNMKERRTGSTTGGSEMWGLGSGSTWQDHQQNLREGAGEDRSEHTVLVVPEGGVCLVQQDERPRFQMMIKST